MSDLLSSLKSALTTALPAYTFHLAVMPDTPTECVVLAELPGPPSTVTTTGQSHEVEYFQVRVRGSTFAGVGSVMDAVSTAVVAQRAKTLGSKWCEAIDPRTPAVTVPGTKAGQFIRTRHFAAFRS